MKMDAFRLGNRMQAAALLLALVGTEKAIAQGRSRPDAAKIKANVEDLERERQLRAQEELERLRLRRVDMASKAQYARQWILSNYTFDAYSVIRELPENLLDSSQAATPQAKIKMEKRLGKLQEQRADIVARIARGRLGEDAMLGQLLSRNSAMNGAIAKGRAANFFLRKCGAAAYDHALYREMTRQKQSLSEPQRPPSLLEQGSAEVVVLDERITRHIRYLQGDVGNKESGRLNEGPLDLAWPAFLRRDEFKSQREAIEKARDNAVAELRAGKPVSNTAADKLLDAVNSLLKRVTQEKRKRIHTMPGEEIWSWVLAEQHAKLLMGGAYRFIEARDAEDVLVETFKSGTIEELMAFMHRNKLEFAPADGNGQSAYGKIVEMMIRYYHDLEALRAAVADLGDAKDQESALAELGLSNATPGGNQPRLGEEGAKAVLDEFQEFDASQPANKAGSNQPKKAIGKATK
jgi:hypothetical protein